MPVKFFDAHTHVNFAAFEKDYREVINRTLGERVGLINVGTQKDTSRRAVEIAHEFSAQGGSASGGENGVWATVGLHPIHTSKSFHDAQELGGDKGFTSRGEDFDYDYYKNLALDSKVVAIGECGLDYFRVEDEKMKNRQKEAFIKQIELAQEVKKPLMIHCRQAFSDLIAILKPNASRLKPSIVHFFSGTKEEAEGLLDMGFYFTFGGVITFVRDYDEIIKMIPLDRILSETDAPYVAPVPHRGRRNEPVYVIDVVKKLAEIKNIPFEEMAAVTLANTREIFNF